MAATAQRFSEENTRADIAWQKRSLQNFGDSPIERLSDSFDLLVIDHPFVGYKAAHPVLNRYVKWKTFDCMLLILRKSEFPVGKD